MEAVAAKYAASFLSLYRVPMARCPPPSNRPWPTLVRDAYDVAVAARLQKMLAEDKEARPYRNVCAVCGIRDRFTGR